MAGDRQPETAGTDQDPHGWFLGQAEAVEQDRCMKRLAVDDQRLRRSPRMPDLAVQARPDHRDGPVQGVDPLLEPGRR